MASHLEALRSLSRHEVYYIPTGDLSVLVEQIQFKIHRYFFERESPYFRAQLERRVSSGPHVQFQGSSDSNSIILENVTPTEFAKFLWVIYNPKYSLYDDATCEDWQIVLRLAHLWTFPEIKKLAIRELEKQYMLDVKRVKLYQDNDVDRNLLISRYAALCEREEPLSLEEGLDLGMATFVAIARGREQARAPAKPHIRGQELQEIVRGLFQIESVNEEVILGTRLGSVAPTLPVPPPPVVSANGSTPTPPVVPGNINSTSPSTGPTSTTPTPTTSSATNKPNARAGNKPTTNGTPITPTNGNPLTIGSGSGSTPLTPTPATPVTNTNIFTNTNSNANAHTNFNKDKKTGNTGGSVSRY